MFVLCILEGGKGHAKTTSDQRQMRKAAPKPTSSLYLKNVAVSSTNDAVHEIKKCFKAIRKEIISATTQITSNKTVVSLINSLKVMDECIRSGFKLFLDIISWVFNSSSGFGS